jgi:predicted phosphodiesterase
MIRLVTSDIHISKNPIDVYRLVFLKETLPALLDKYKATQLIVAGDITQDKDGHPASLVNEMVECFHNLSKKCEIIILQGNHDASNVQDPFFQFLSKFDNIKWISAPIVLDNCLYLPHTRDYKKDWVGIDFEGHDFIIAHNTFGGTTVNGQSLSGIPTNIFPDDAAVLSGDIHEPQQVDVVTYIGSPFLCSFGDDYQPRVLVLDGLKAKSVKLHGQQKRLINMHWPNDIELLYPLVQEKDIVKIQVHLRMEHVAKWADIRQEVEQWATNNKFVLNSIIPVVEYDKGERQKIASSVRRTDNEYVSAFVKRNGIDSKVADIGLDIIEIV